ncbi:hypothetical protein RKE29_13825, partial [Streptomyces sp. B1866]|nr:hypothetical protein [Streptomyces sp. B1866]
SAPAAASTGSPRHAARNQEPAPAGGPAQGGGRPSPALPLRTAHPRAEEDADRPPLPRRSGTYLAPEFYENDSACEDDAAGPTPGLMARFSEGVARADGDGPLGSTVHTS